MFALEHKVCVATALFSSLVTLCCATENDAKLARLSMFAKAKKLPGPYRSTVGLPQHTDIRQGTSGDCWLLSMLAAFTVSNKGIAHISKIMKPVKRKRKPCVEVKLHNGQAKLKTLTVNSNFSKLLYSNSQARPESRWFLHLEKAIAALKGHPSDVKPGLGYDALDGGSPREAFTFLTSYPSETFLLNDYSDNDLRNLIEKYFGPGCEYPMVFHSIEGHDWALIKVDVRTFRVFNPWNTNGSWANNTEHYDIRELRTKFDKITVGFLNDKWQRTTMDVTPHPEENYTKVLHLRNDSEQAHAVWVRIHRSDTDLQNDREACYGVRISNGPSDIPVNERRQTTSLSEMWKFTMSANTKYLIETTGNVARIEILVEDPNAKMISVSKFGRRLFDLAPAKYEKLMEKRKLPWIESPYKSMPLTQSSDWPKPRAPTPSRRSRRSKPISRTPVAHRIWNRENRPGRGAKPQSGYSLRYRQARTRSPREPHRAHRTAGTAAA